MPAYALAPWKKEGEGKVRCPLGREGVELPLRCALVIELGVGRVA